MSTDDNHWKLALKAGFQIVIACVAYEELYGSTELLDEDDTK